MNADKIVSSLYTARQTDPNMSVTSLLAFLLIAGSDGDLSPTDIQDKMDLTTGTISRTLANLSEWERYPTRRGLDLIVIHVDPADRRRRRLQLTAKGRNLFARLVGKE